MHSATIHTCRQNTLVFVNLRENRVFFFSGLLNVWFLVFGGFLTVLNLLQISAKRPSPCKAFLNKRLARHFFLLSSLFSVYCLGPKTLINPFVSVYKADYPVHTRALALLFRDMNSDTGI